LKGLVDTYIGTKYAGSAININRASNQGNDTRTAARMTIGFLAMFMLLFTGSGIRLILEDKKSKTFMRTFSAPLKSYEMVLGSLIANFLLGLLQVLLFLIITRYVLKIDFSTSLLSVFILLCAYLVTAVGLSICLIGFIKNEKLYNALNSQLATIICMLGGCFVPLSMLPKVLQKSANFIPQKWLMDGFEKMTSGASLYDIRIQLSILLLFGLVFFTFGVKTLRPEEADL
jgi:ABC-type multidrug transport system permease subunit